MTVGRYPGYDPEAYARGLRDANPDAKGPWGEFGRETVENTTTWGNTTNLAFNAVGGEPVVQQSTQLIAVSRRRPTNFTLMTLITLGAFNWTGEINPLLLQVLVNIGVGQAVAYAQRNFVIPAAALLNGAQVVLDLFSPIPAQAINSQVKLTFNGPHNVGAHDLQITQLAAPLVQ
jgi:hypothetical protein